LQSWPLSHAAGEVLLLELLPAGEATDEECETSAGDSHGEGDLETLHVTVDDDELLLGCEGLANFSGAGEDEGGLADIGGVAGDVLDHFVDEGGLATGDDEGTTKTLEDFELLVFGRPRGEKMG
jgi:hypothetical protein